MTTPRRIAKNYKYDKPPLDIATFKGEPWHRQDGETERAHNAFMIYLDLGRGRTLKKLKEFISTSDSMVSKWQDTYQWDYRLARFDAFIDKQALGEIIVARKEMVRRHTKVASEIIEKIEERLATIDPDTLTPTEIARWLDIAAKVERMAFGEADKAFLDEITPAEEFARGRETASEPQELEELHQTINILIQHTQKENDRQSAIITTPERGAEFRELESGGIVEAETIPDSEAD